ncbi:MAG: hypothetical protein ACXWYM_00280 [Candidatus Binatia bacterium]
MTEFARGNKAWGRCARSGRRMLINRMVEDGRFPGLLVDPNWRESKHPQDELMPIDGDPVSLHRAAPDYERVKTVVFFPNYALIENRTNSPLALNMYFGSPSYQYDADFDFQWVDSDGDQMVTSDGDTLFFS